MIPMQHRNLQWDFAWNIVWAAILFWIGMAFTPDALGSSVYGEFAQYVEAEAWSSAFMGAALLVIYGIHINGRWRWSPFMRVGGYAILTILFSLLVYSSFSASAGVVIWSWTIPCFLRPCIRYLRLNLSDAAQRWRRSNGGE